MFGIFMTSDQAKVQRKAAEVADAQHKWQIAETERLRRAAFEVPKTIWVHKHMRGYDNPVEVSRPITDIEDYHEYQLTPSKK